MPSDQKKKTSKESLCPFCGSADLFQIVLEDAKGEGTQVHCLSCLCRGPIARDKNAVKRAAKAVKLWNKALRPGAIG